MIDYIALKSYGEKFIAYVLSQEPPMRQQQIIDKFGLNEGHLRTILKSLIGQGVVTSFTNEFDITLYHATDAHRPSTDAQRPPVSSPLCVESANCGRHLKSAARSI